MARSCHIDINDAKFRGTDLNRSCRYVLVENKTTIQRLANMDWVLFRATTLQVSSVAIPSHFWIHRKNFYQEIVVRLNVALKILFPKMVLTASQIRIN